MYWSADRNIFLHQFPPVPTHQTLLLYLHRKASLRQQWGNMHISPDTSPEEAAALLLSSKEQLFFEIFSKILINTPVAVFWGLHLLSFLAYIFLTSLLHLCPKICFSPFWNEKSLWSKSWHFRGKKMCHKICYEFLYKMTKILLFRILPNISFLHVFSLPMKRRKQKDVLSFTSSCTLYYS